MISSRAYRGRRVPFPEFQRERIYMLPFCKDEPLPQRYARWQPTVDAMLDGVDAPGQIYLMVDQALVRPGHCHRRAGPHVDGRWVPTLAGHEHQPAPQRDRVQALLLAFDQPGACGWFGDIEGEAGPGGDCSLLDLRRAVQIELQPDVVWAADACAFVHASVPARQECFRTVVRLNVCGWLPRGM